MAGVRRWVVPVAAKARAQHLPPASKFILCLQPGKGKYSLAACPSSNQSTGWRNMRIRVKLTGSGKVKMGASPTGQPPFKKPFPWTSALLTTKATLRNGAMSLLRSHSLESHSTLAFAAQNSPLSSALGYEGKEGRRATADVLSQQ